MALEQDIIIWQKSGERIKKQLETAGQTLIRTLMYSMDLKEISLRVKRNPTYLKQIVSGELCCSPDTYLKLCEVLNANT